MMMVMMDVSLYASSSSKSVYRLHVQLHSRDASHRIAFVRFYVYCVPTSLSSRALRSARTRRLASRALVSRLDEPIERVEPDGARFIVRGAVDEVLQTAHGGDGTDDDGERGDGFHRLRASSSSSSVSR